MALGMFIDAVGVLVIVIGTILASVVYVFKKQGRSFQAYRTSLGKAILLGLELLVAGDIIRTVVIAPTIPNVITLGIIVLIRTFLSMSMQLEVEGCWPWQRNKMLQKVPCEK
ncbi:MAG: DUF1622 domain-containing protein [Armatimonadota bacterium]